MFITGLLASPIYPINSFIFRLKEFSPKISTFFDSDVVLRNPLFLKFYLKKIYSCNSVVYGQNNVN